MEKLLEIVGSLIPDDKKEEVKLKLDEEVEALKKATVKETKRELSSKYGVNLFEEDIDKAFNNGKFVNKELLTTKDEEIAKLTTQITDYQKQVSTLVEEKDLTNIKMELQGKGFNMDRFDIATNLLPKEGTIEERVANLFEKVPELFMKQTNQVVGKSVLPNNNNVKTTNGFEEYIKKNTIK